MKELEEAYEDWRADACYECGGYGDDYRYDEDTGEWVSNCEDCWVMMWEDDYE